MRRCQLRPQRLQRLGGLASRQLRLLTALLLQARLPPYCSLLRGPDLLCQLLRWRAGMLQLDLELLYRQKHTSMFVPATNSPSKPWTIHGPCMIYSLCHLIEVKLALTLSLQMQSA